MNQWVLKDLGNNPKHLGIIQIKEKVQQKILFLKAKHPSWGTKKIHKLLFNDCSSEDIPSVVTVHNILAKNGL
ncbi:helix-turn-helix domain-containing protein, partial [Xanthovirga aplysinae]|uniref:helix-turn-helix domain-containing protein n=1 Tax=Xanthovirga aplysinae TaxID=2529853 RepID=UPI001FE4C7B7